METEPTSGAQWTAQGDLKRGSSTPRTNSLGWLCKRMETLFQLQLCRYNGSWRGGLFHGRGVWNEGGHTYTGGFLYGKVKHSSASKSVFKNKLPLQCIVVENLHRFNIWQSLIVTRSRKRVDFLWAILSHLPTFLWFRLDTWAGQHSMWRAAIKRKLNSSNFMRHFPAALNLTQKNPKWQMMERKLISTKRMGHSCQGA